MNYPGTPEEQARSVPAITPDEILLPAPQLIIPAARDRQFPIRTADWLQLRSKIGGLSNPFPNIASLGWACVGIAAAAALHISLGSPPILSCRQKSSNSTPTSRPFWE